MTDERLRAVGLPVADMNARLHLAGDPTDVEHPVARPGPLEVDRCHVEAMAE